MDLGPGPRLAPATLATASAGGSLADRLLGERIVVLGREIDDEVADTVCSQLLLLAAESPRRDITLYLNSPGGSPSAAMAIYDTMWSIEPDVATVVHGTAVSTAQFLLTAGAPGKRGVLEHARVVMHHPRGGGGGIRDVRVHSEQLTRQKLEIAELTARHSGRTVADVLADSENDRWFDAAEAVAHGLADRVVTRIGSAMDS